MKINNLKGKCLKSKKNLGLTLEQISEALDEMDIRRKEYQEHQNKKIENYKLQYLEETQYQQQFPNIDEIYLLREIDEIYQEQKETIVINKLNKHMWN